MSEDQETVDSLPVMSLIFPVLGLITLALTWGKHDLPTVVLVVVGVMLIASVLSAVLHADTIAHRVGEPGGSLVLAMAVTIIEVGLIVTLMLAGKPGAESVARDTAFAAIMICCNIIVGLSIMVVALRDGMASFRAEGPISAVSAVATLATLSLVLPTFTSSTPGPTFNTTQLAFAAVASFGVYVLFVLVQNVRNRDHFVSVIADQEDTGSGRHAHPGPRRTLAAAIGLLCALVAVVGLAKVETPGIEALVDVAGLPLSFVGVIIASIVLLPEGISAVQSARRGRIQTSLNLAYGSALASIGLTIPAVALATIWVSGPLVLGLGPREIVLLVLTVLVSALSVIPGRATLLEGGLHLAVGGAFFVMAIVP